MWGEIYRRIVVHEWRVNLYYIERSVQKEKFAQQARNSTSVPTSAKHLCSTSDL